MQKISLVTDGWKHSLESPFRCLDDKMKEFTLTEEGFLVLGGSSGGFDTGEFQ